jgi:hypothetical protein
MKKVLLSAMVGLMLFSGCADNKVIDQKEYTTYGFFNESDSKNPEIQYSLSVGNVIWGIVLVETIIAPVYFFGFSLYEPEGKIGTVEKGVVN